MSEKQGFESPPPTYNQAQGYPPQTGYPPQGYPPQQPQQGYPPPQQGYPAQPGYNPVPQGYPPNQPGYPPQAGQPTTVVVAQPMASNVVVTGGPQPPDYMIASILACLCCFWPTGLCAIYYACRRNTLMGEGNVPEATRMSSSARNFIIASVVLGICWIVLVIVLRLVVATSTVASEDYYY